VCGQEIIASEATIKPKSSFDNNAGFRDELLLLKLIYGSARDAFKALLEELRCASTLRRLRRRYSPGMRVEHPLSELCDKLITWDAQDRVLYINALLRWIDRYCSF